MTDELIVSVENGIQVITLNRPQVRNAVNLAIAEGVAAALDELDGRDDIRVAVITGAGGTFCAGMDLKAFMRGERPRIKGRGFMGLTESLPKKPLIAAIEGYALGGGFEVALACDLIVAAEDAMFGLPEVKRGLVAACGGLARLPRQIPSRIAMELALTGDMMPASRACAYGLINRLSSPGSALADAMAMAGAIIRNGPLAVATSKRVIMESQDWPAADMFTLQEAIIDPVFTSGDAREGAAAFAEKRPPVWRGR